MWSQSRALGAELLEALASMALVVEAERPIESIAEHVPSLSPELVRILDAAITIDPQGRPPDAGALLDALNGAIGRPSRTPSVVSLAPDSGSSDPGQYQDSHSQTSDLEYHGSSANSGQWVLIIFGLIAAAMFLATVHAN